MAGLPDKYMTFDRLETLAVSFYPPKDDQDYLGWKRRCPNLVHGFGSEWFHGFSKRLVQGA
jgi:hypothetical protein